MSCQRRDGVYQEDTHAIWPWHIWHLHQDNCYKKYQECLELFTLSKQKTSTLGTFNSAKFHPFRWQKSSPSPWRRCGVWKNLPNKNPKPLRKSSKFGPSKIGIHRDIQGPLKVRNSWIAAMKHAANLWWNFEGIFFHLRYSQEVRLGVNDPFLSVPLRYSIKCGISKLIRSEKPLFSQKDCIFIWHATTTNRGPLHMF